MTKIQEIVYAIPEDVFKDEVFKKLVHTKRFSRLRCLGPECLSQAENEYAFAFSKRTIEALDY